MAGEKFREAKNYFPKAQYTHRLQLCGLHTYHSIPRTLINGPPFSMDLIIVMPLSSTHSYWITLSVVGT